MYLEPTIHIAFEPNHPCPPPNFILTYRHIKAGAGDPSRNSDFTPVAMSCAYCHATKGLRIVVSYGARVCVDQETCRKRRRRKMKQLAR